jgi:dolichyl-phosphate beta-glucosyltransferase
MKLSVIIPAYNEEARISATLASVTSYLARQAYQSEVIVVVNGSVDRTYEVVKLAAEQNAETLARPEIVAMNIIEGGKGNAVKRGILEKASGDVVMFMDADNATPISELEKFFPLMREGCDVVIGSRYIAPELVKVRQPFYRIVLSRMSNLLIQMLAVPGIKDTQLGFKAFTGVAAKNIFPYVTVTRWGFDMEVLTIALAQGYRIREVGVAWTEHGGGHVPLRAYMESLGDLIKIKLNRLAGAYDRKESTASDLDCV